ncbi:UDP-2,4-diacetamido-2,4,6-trideoxy-beta-L-altropyranose hydrolase [Enterovibrio calviensis]|uniref:UDP-2,4-diacetamido-2,4, 6-trideoxy-beta-L-altropyranose hydrolase n=1 Tax=Enterovibrio calviensis TaxID=91359 RepID=UPI0037367DCE
MNVAIRVDASSQIGTGHVMRCLVLAKKLIEHGHHVRMLSRELTGNLLEYCRRQNIHVLPLPAIEETFLADTGDYAHWLGVTQEEDAHQCLAMLDDITLDWVAFDHYAIDEKWQSLMKTSGAKVLAIDDLANRRHACDILLDHNPWPDVENRYHSWVPTECQQLLGPRFALLRDSFSALRDHDLSVIKNQIVAFFSGTDPTGETLKLLHACQQFSTLPFNVVIVYGMANPRKEALLMEAVPEFIELVESLPDFETELACSRYAFGAAGVSAIERTCLRLPSTLVSVAENQRDMAEHLAKSGQYRYLGLSNITTASRYAQELTWLAEHWDALPLRLPESDIDGLGAERVVRAMENCQ